MKFGFYANAVVLPGEDPTAYEALKQQVWSDIRPGNALEEIYTREIVDAVWRLQRLAFIEGTVFTRRSLSFSGDDCGPGFAFVNDAQGLDAFAKLARYEAGPARRLHRALEQLRKLRQTGFTPSSQPSHDSTVDSYVAPPVEVVPHSTGDHGSTTDDEHLDLTKTTTQMGADGNAHKRADAAIAPVVGGTSATSQGRNPDQYTSDGKDGTYES